MEAGAGMRTSQPINSRFLTRLKDGGLGMTFFWYDTVIHWGRPMADRFYLRRTAFGSREW
jgi:hypothetical protein